jgi:hypothetical protein
MKWLKKLSLPVAQKNVREKYPSKNAQKRTIFIPVVTIFGRSTQTNQLTI